MMFIELTLVLVNVRVRVVALHHIVGGLCFIQVGGVLGLESLEPAVLVGVHTEAGSINLRLLFTLVSVYPSCQTIVLPDHAFGLRFDGVDLGV